MQLAGDLKPSCQEDVRAGQPQALQKAYTACMTVTSPAYLKAMDGPGRTPRSLLLQEHTAFDWGAGAAVARFGASTGAA